MSVFTRPSRANRSRSSACPSMSSGAETPPLSISEGYSSFLEGSQSSIDLSRVNYTLSNDTHPLSNATLDHVQPRARARGHRRRIYQARASRTSIYDTIEEELMTSFPPIWPLGSATKTIQIPHSATKTVDHAPVYVVDPETAPGDSVSLWDGERGIILGSATMAIQLPRSATKTVDHAPVCVVDPETASGDSVSLWDDERGIMALRKYYALCDEAHDAVTESKQV